ncbi:hypothetical protein Q4I32_004263 [Leishmania shawi]|uniref:CUE domain-containing protein n=1 Tax=Leishmania shawi TaxID=5680 RepID=A0AAW3BSF4_9TRYP
MDVTSSGRPIAEDATAEAAVAAMAHANVDALSMLDEHRSRIETFLMAKIQDLVVQELADMLSNGNVSQVIETLMKVLPPPLRSVVTRDDSVLPGAELSANNGATSSMNGGEDVTHDKATAQPVSWRGRLANALDLHSASAIKSLVYDSLSGSSAGALNGINDSSISGTMAAGHKGEIDWLTVSRPIASRPSALRRVCAGSVLPSRLQSARRLR